MTAARQDARRPSIFLATPAYGGQANILFFKSLLELQPACEKRGVGLHIELTGGDALITRARSRMATQFLEETDHTHLMFVDADIAFRPEHIFRLLDAGKDLVGGVYPLKLIDWAKVDAAVKGGMKDVQAASLGYVVGFTPTPDQAVDVDDAGFGRVDSIGTGFMLISRRALEQVRDANPQLRCRLADMNLAAREVTLFFDTMIDPDTREHLSEDYAFCRRWRDVGGEVYADFQTRLSHIGHATFTGSLMDAVAR
jgi:hypothetical protein